MSKLKLSLLILVLTLLGSFHIALADSAIDNGRVIQMAKAGIDDDIIIAKIKASSCNFSLEDSDLGALKSSGVSSKVVAAMLDSMTLTAPKVTIDSKLVEIHTLGQAKVGGRIGSALTYGIKSVKSKAYLSNPHAALMTSTAPKIIIELPKGDTIDNYMLVQLDKKDDRRELEVGSTGGIVGGKTGIRAEAIRKTAAISLGGNKFDFKTAEALKPGEYIIYEVGSADKIKEIYGKGFDFTVE